MKKALMYTIGEITPILEHIRRDPFFSLNDIQEIKEADVVFAEYKDKYYCVIKDRARSVEYGNNYIHTMHIGRYLAGEKVELCKPKIVVNPHCEMDDFEDVLGDAIFELEKNEVPVINVASRMDVND